MLTQEHFLEKAKHISEEAKSRNIELRLLGALAFRIHCPQFGFMQDRLGRVFTDIDFVGRSNQREAIRAFMKDMGFREDFEVTVLYGGDRLTFDEPGGLHSDVFLDALDFCHRIELKNRLHLDFPTISLADLLLEKLQIVRINEKDIIDTCMLLCEHDLGREDRESIDADFVAARCAQDWGLWRTLTINLDKILGRIEQYDLAAEDRERVKDRAKRLLSRIEAEPKSLSWRMRARLGERVKWYKDVDELKG
ncbi:MAG: hypothetical protein ACOZCF_10790 [Bacillota bacterium]